MSRICLPLLLIVLALPAAVQADEPAVGSSLLLPQIEVRPGVTMDVHVTVWGDVTEGDCQFLVTGFHHASPSWGPYAEALPAGSCALALDLPGRPLSSVPAGIVFGELTMEDDVTVVLETLARLRDVYDVEPKTIVGHSMGGGLVQRAQQRLLDAGSSLEKSFDIKEAVLLASVSPAGLPFFLADSGAADALLSAFVQVDPQLGAVVVMPTFVWPALFFTNLAGEVAPGTPTPAEMDVAGYSGFAEPLFVALQLVGAGGLERVQVEPGAFAEDVRLRLLVYAEDTLVPVFDGDDLYRHLTGDDAFGCFAVVQGAHAVHDLHVSSPATVVAMLAALDGCEYGG